jgi:hypothetical protein
VARPIPECQALGPVPENPFEPVMSEIPDLTEFGLTRGMDAREAYARLSAQGICHEFRLEFPAINRGQVWCVPPLGEMREYMYGSRGEVIVFVEDPALRTFDPNMPETVGC